MDEETKKAADAQESLVYSSSRYQRMESDRERMRKEIEASEERFGTIERYCEEEATRADEAEARAKRWEERAKRAEAMAASELFVQVYTHTHMTNC